MQNNQGFNFHFNILKKKLYHDCNTSWLRPRKQGLRLLKSPSVTSYALFNFKYPINNQIYFLSTAILNRKYLPYDV